MSTTSTTSENKEAFDGKGFLTALVIFGSVFILFLALQCLSRCFFYRSCHPRPSGLRRSVIAALPIVAYQKGRKDEDGDGPDECPVCLGELEEGDKVRLLPRCKHLFHVDCIDKWLFSHSTCPICRESAKPPDPVRSHGSLPPGVMAGLANAKETGSTSGLGASFQQMLNRELSGRIGHSSIGVFQDLERQ